MCLHYSLCSRHSSGVSGTAVFYTKAQNYWASIIYPKTLLFQQVRVVSCRSIPTTKWHINPQSDGKIAELPNALCICVSVFVCTGKCCAQSLCENLPQQNACQEHLHHLSCKSCLFRLIFAFAATQQTVNIAARHATLSRWAVGRNHRVGRWCETKHTTHAYFAECAQPYAKARHLLALLYSTCTHFSARYNFRSHARQRDAHKVVAGKRAIAVRVQSEQKRLCYAWRPTTKTTTTTTPTRWPIHRVRKTLPVAMLTTTTGVDDDVGNVSSRSSDNTTPPE